MGEVTLKDNVKPAAKPKKKRIWWRVLLAFLGGFIFFPISVVGTGAILGTVFTTKQVVTMFGGNPDEVLGEDYQNSTLLQAIMTIAQKANDGGFQTLEDLNTVSPLIEKTVNTTLEQIFAGLIPPGSDLPITWEDIKDANFVAGEGIHTTTGSPLADKILDTLTLASLLDTGEEELKGIYLYFLYPVLTDESGNKVYDETGHVAFDYDHPYTINYFVENGATAFNDVLDSVVIGDVVDPGDNNLLNAMKNWQLGDMSENINTLMIKDIFSEQQLNDSTLLSAIQNWSLGNFGTDDQIDALKIGNLFDLSAGGDLMNTISNFYIGNLRGYEIVVDEEGELVSRGAAGSFEITENIYLKDVISGESKLLDQFKDKSIAELADITMDDIYLKNVFEEAVYKKGIDDSEYNRVIAAIMENERKDRYDAEKAIADLAGESFPSYEDWLLNEENADYKATVAILTKEGTIDGLKLGDVIDVDEDSILNSFKNKSISQLSSIGMDEIYLKDLFDKDTYIKSDDPVKAEDYNAVIGAIMENERKDRYKESGTLIPYEDWLLDEDNADYKSTAETLTDPNLLDNIILKDILTIEEGTVLWSFRDKTISELEDFDVNDMKLADIISKDVYILNPSNPDEYNKVIFAMMDNERKDRYDTEKAIADLAGEPFPSYEDWLLDEDNAEFRATVSTLTEEGTIQKLRLGDVIDVEDSILSSFEDKKISELNTLSMDDIYLRDLFEEAVYKKGVDPDKYNRVVAALMENERVKAWKAAVEAGTFTGSYSDWKDAGLATYDATAAVLSDQSAIDALKITDVMDTSTLVPGTTVYNLIHTLEEDDEANIGNLSDKIGSIEMGELFGLPKDGDNYKDYADWTDEEKGNNPYVLYSLRESTLNTLNSDLNDLTLGQTMDVTGTIFDNEELKNCKVSDGVDIADTMKSALRLNQVVDIDSSSPKILQTLGEYKLNQLEDKVQDLTLGDVIDIDEHSSKLLQALEDAPIFDKSAFQDKIETLKFGDVIDIDENSSKILRNLEDTSIFEDDALENKLKDMTLNEIIDIYEEDVYKKDEYGNYLDVNDQITTDPSKYVLLHEKSSPIVLSLKDVKVLSENGLSNKLNDLMIRDVLTEEDCEGSNVLMALWNDNVDAHGKGAVKITEIGSKINNVKIIDILGDDIYEHYESAGEAEGKYDDATECYHEGYIYLKTDTGYTHKKITGTWWFLLTSKKDYDERAENGLVDRYVLVSGLTYQISSMQSLVANMEYHMQNETLYTLYDAGLLNLDDPSILDKDIPTEYTGMIPTHFEKMGNMTIRQFANAIGICPLF